MGTGNWDILLISALSLGKHDSEEGGSPSWSACIRLFSLSHLDVLRWDNNKSENLVLPSRIAPHWPPPVEHPTGIPWATWAPDSKMRRKHSHLETDDSTSQTAHLMGRESFTFDDDRPTMPHSQNSNASFWERARQDRRNFLLLVLLYFLQGIPMRLAGGLMPFLFKKNLSYSQIAFFSLSSYPCSLKFL